MKAPEIRLLGVIRNLVHNQNAEKTLAHIVDDWANVAIDPTGVPEAVDLLKDYITTQIQTLDTPASVNVITLVLTVMVRLDSVKAHEVMTELLDTFPQPFMYRETIENAKEAIRI